MRGSLRRILDGVVDQVPDGGLQLLDVAADHGAAIIDALDVGERVGVEPEARAGELDALADQFGRG